MKTYPSKLFTSEMQGAHIFTKGTMGQINTLLKQILVTGFGSLVPTSIEYNSNKKLAVATFQNGHSYLPHSVISITGCDVDTYNGESRVIEVTETECFFELNGVPISSVGNPEASEVKVAGAGWTLDADSSDGMVTIISPKDSKREDRKFVVWGRDEASNVCTSYYSSSTNYGAVATIGFADTTGGVDPDNIIQDLSVIFPADKSDYGITAWEVIASGDFCYIQLQAGRYQYWNTSRPNQISAFFGRLEDQTNKLLDEQLAIGGYISKAYSKQNYSLYNLNASSNATWHTPLYFLPQPSTASVCNKADGSYSNGLANDLTQSGGFVHILPSSFPSPDSVTNAYYMSNEQAYCKYNNGNLIGKLPMIKLQKSSTLNFDRTPFMINGKTYHQFWTCSQDYGQGYLVPFIFDISTVEV